MTKNTLNNANYRTAVLSTESKPAVINFGPATLAFALNLAISTSNFLDQVKRAIYYGRDIDQEKAVTALREVNKLSADLFAVVSTASYRDPNDAALYSGLPPEARAALNLSGVDVRLLHAALGMQTESGEFIEGILPTLFGRPLDKVNLLEELGDASWYGDIALDALGYSREQCNFTNIKKLTDKKAGRYQKGAFDPNAAVARDVTAERDLLEEGATQ